MESQVLPKNNDQMIDELRQCATLLADKLQSDKFDEATDLIKNIVDSRDEYIFQSVGKLTRGLHNAIVNFNVDGQAKCSVDQAVNSECELNDASSRLEYVIQLTQDAADKTMDKVEACTPLSAQLSEEAISLKKEWSRLKSREMSPDEFRDLYKRLDAFFDTMNTNTTQLNDNLMSITLEQGYQDLTGQVLKKVISLVTEVEGHLVDLMRMASQVEKITGLEIEEPEKNNHEDVKKEADIAGEGPQHKASERNDVVNGQDDVDDLLSSLGF